MTQPKTVYGFEEYKGRFKSFKDLSHESCWSAVKRPDATERMGSSRLEIWQCGSEH
jgi:hypothetical protein